MHNQTTTKTSETVLFQDPMTGDWQENWFLDGKKATLEHREGGLYFAAGTVTKAQDRQEYHAHHAVLWTKMEFEGDIRVSFECKPVDASDYGNVLIYIQAQGIGVPPYVHDIYAWRELREVPAMEKYFNDMSLLSVSLRQPIRCKRYPWNDIEKNIKFEPLIEPMYDWHGMVRDKWFRFVIDKHLRSLTFRSYDLQTGELLTECTWDTSKNPEQQMPRLIEKGRIGLRHMSTKQCIYRNFVVTRL
ncbi:MAG: hypothetical protein GC164_05105 [Phycisphaera sp.]|nr:hypothetical protein [Phycisphaera sp.]